MAGSIFDKQLVLKPSTMGAVAERRFADAEALISTEKNAHANGAAYMAGFVIEILLKAQLVAKFPTIARKRQHEVLDAEKPVWLLIWKQHDLEEMLDRLPELAAALKKRGERAGRNYFGNLEAICAVWTIQARYSSRTMLLSEAKQILERVRSLKEFLK